ncbi:YraN family protein [Skermania piniformis]
MGRPVRPDVSPVAVTVGGMAHNQNLGAHGEDLAAEFLTAAGMQILARNWRCRYGELDLVATDGDTTVFVEVKTRAGFGFGSPAEAVTQDKRRRVRRLAAIWLDEWAGPWTEVRFDVVSVQLADPTAPELEHYPGVF